MKPTDDQAAPEAPGDARRVRRTDPKARPSGGGPGPGSPGTSPTSASASSPPAPTPSRARRPTDVVLFLLAALDPRAGLDRGAGPDGGRPADHQAGQRPPRAPGVVLGGRQRPAGPVAARPARRRGRGVAAAVPAPRSAPRDGPGRRRGGAGGRWRFGVGGRAHGHGPADPVSGRPGGARDRADRDDLPAPQPADPPPRPLDRHPGLARRGRARDRAAARRGFGAGDRARLRGARAPRVRLARRAPVAGPGAGGARGARGGDDRPAVGRAPAQGGRPPAGRDAAGAAAPRQGLWARRLGRPAAHRDLVVPVVPGRVAHAHDQPPATGRTRGVRHPARRALRGPGAARDRRRCGRVSGRGARAGGRWSSDPGARARRDDRCAPRRPVARAVRDARGRDRARESGRAAHGRLGRRVGADRRLPGGERQRHAAGAARRSRSVAGDDGADHRRRPVGAGGAGGHRCRRAHRGPPVHPARGAQPLHATIAEGRGARPGRDPGPGGGRRRDRAAEARAAPAGHDRFGADDRPPAAGRLLRLHRDRERRDRPGRGRAQAGRHAPGCGRAWSSSRSSRWRSRSARSGPRRCRCGSVP